MQTKILQGINVALLGVNGIVFLFPKKPLSHLPSNAAGLLLGGAAAIALMIFLHALLLFIALHYQKEKLLQILSGTMIVLSILFWWMLYNFYKA